MRWFNRRRKWLAAGVMLLAAATAAAAAILYYTASQGTPQLLWQQTLEPGGWDPRYFADASIKLFGADAIQVDYLYRPESTVYGFDGKEHLNVRGIQLQAGIPGSSSVASAADGRYYICKTEYSPNAIKSGVGAYDAQGNLGWTFAPTGRMASCRICAVGPDGTVFVGTSCLTKTASKGLQKKSELYAFTPDGKQKWIKTLPGTTQFPVVVAADGTVYAMSAGQGVIALSPEGKTKWQTPDNSVSFQSGPLLAGDLLICCSPNHDLVAAYNSGGSLVWQYRPRTILTAAAAGSDGTVFVIENLSYQTPCELHAIGKDGKVRWSYPVKGDPYYGGESTGIFHRLVPTPDGGVVFFEPTAVLLARATLLDQAGRLQGRLNMPTSAASPIALPGGKALFLSMDGMLRCWQF